MALTFDDGPTPRTTPRILAALDRARATATFFLSGIRLHEHLDIASEIVAAGHSVFGHGWEHEDLAGAREETALQAVCRVEELLSRVRPTPNPYLLRLPYGAGHNRYRMHRAMRRFHPDVRFAWWSINPRDWRIAENIPSAQSLDQRCRLIASRISAAPALPGSVILLHDEPFGSVGDLANDVIRFLLPALLDGIAARGLRAGPIQCRSEFGPPRWLPQAPRHRLHVRTMTQFSRALLATQERLNGNA